jgi:hypothetical protein
LVKPGSKNKIRVFPVDKYTLTSPRNNNLYDSIMKDFDNTRTENQIKEDDRLKGHRGKCILRELTYFDMGVSFLSDSLHNCYHGATVRLVQDNSACPRNATLQRLSIYFKT